MGSGFMRYIELGKDFSMTDYVVLTAIQQYRTRYVIPVSDTEDCDPQVFISDSVTCQDVKEFSQLDLGETIIDTQLIDEQELLELFDADNDYLSGWSKTQKLSWINNWEEQNA